MTHKEKLRETEATLLRLQVRVAQSQSSVQRQVLRDEYRRLHTKWVDLKSQAAMEV